MGLAGPGPLTGLVGPGPLAGPIVVTTCYGLGKIAPDGKDPRVF
jgi:hypothetical protein